MIDQPGPSPARQVVQWIAFAVIVLAIVGSILLVGRYFMLGSCACTQSPSPTSTPTAWHLPFLG